MKSKSLHPTSKRVKHPAEVPHAKTAKQPAARTDGSGVTQDTGVATSQGGQTEETYALAKQAGTSDERHAQIETAAYFLAVNRGFRKPDSLKDWLQAESENDAQLSGHRHFIS